jgi:endonuclease/exonuclease/phosphatase family metal-dependent hydrolase
MLQEVRLSTFAEDFAALLADGRYGFCVQAESAKRPYANAILFRTPRFELVREESRSRAQIAVLREVDCCAETHAAAAAVPPTDTPAAEQDAPGAGGAGEARQAALGRRIWYLANVHLQKGSQEEVTRLMQLRSLFKRLAHHRDEQCVLEARSGRPRARNSAGRRRGVGDSASSEGGRTLPESAIICGDFNCRRHSQVYELMREAGLRRFPSTQRRADGALGGGMRVYRTHFLRLQDTYDSRRPQWGPYSYSHASGALLDYVWASTDLEVLETMPRALDRADVSERFPEPSATKLAAALERDAPSAGADARPAAFGRRARFFTQLPSKDGKYPSDHLPMGCVVAPHSAASSPTAPEAAPAATPGPAAR